MSLQRHTLHANRGSVKDYPEFVRFCLLSQFGLPSLRDQYRDTMPHALTMVWEGETMYSHMMVCAPCCSCSLRHRMLAGS